MDSMKEKVTQSAKFYQQSILNFDYQLAEFNFEALSPFFNGNMALEIGPASGYMTKLLVHKFNSIDLLEPSKDLLDKIPDYPNAVKICSYLEEYEPEKMYDTIIMSHVLEHIENPVPALMRIRSWLKADGVFLVSVPNAKSIHRMVAAEMRLLDSIYTLNARDHELGHYRVYDLVTLKDHLISAGFTVNKTGGIFLKPLSNSQIEQQWTPEMIQGFKKVATYFPEYSAEIYAVCTI